MTFSREATVWPHTDLFNSAETALERVQSVIEHREQLRELDRYFVIETARGYEQEFEDVETQTEDAQNNPHINPEHPKERVRPLGDAAKRHNGAVNVQQHTLKEENKRHNHPKAQKKRCSELFKTIIGWNKKLKRVFLSSKSGSGKEAATSIEDEDFPENREDPGMANPSALPSSLASPSPVPYRPEQYSPNDTRPSPKANVEFAQDRTRDLQNLHSTAIPAAAVTHQSSQSRPNLTWRWHFAPDLSKSIDRQLIRRRGAVDFTPSVIFPIPPVCPSTPLPLYN